MGIATDVVTVLHPAAEDVAEPQCLAPRGLRIVDAGGVPGARRAGARRVTATERHRHRREGGHQCRDGRLPAGLLPSCAGGRQGGIVSGPVARRFGIHSGTAALGSGHRGNATIGRALRLTMRNLGGATADTMEKSTHGWPGKYTMCFAENSERNPWEPLHVELGFASETSIVVVVAARGLITIVESSQESGLGDLAEPDSEGHGALALRP
jgi:hypothetical protein